ncbi:MAG TPA: Hsp20/alpha crystallin family protein [Candidatus Dormibacteraeota bacterium]
MIRWPYFESSPLRPLLEQLLSEERQRAGRQQGEPMPVNVYEGEGGLVIDAAVPGAGPEDVDIQCAEGVLTIRARSRVPEREFMHQEIRPVEYVRQLALPADCRFEAAEAEAENGILTIRIPKTRPKAPEKIKIQVARRGGDARTIDAKPGTYTEVKPRKPRR